MKKILIGIVATTAVAGATYLGFNKVGDVAETAITEFTQQYSGTPLTLSYLTSSPFIEEATWEITQANDKIINSRLIIQFINEKTLDIPLVSQIIRGKTTYNNQSYGFGKIVTHPDLSQIDELPDGITGDTFTINKYIGLDGSVTAVNEIRPIKTDELDFQGLTAVVNTSLIDTSNYEATMTTKGLTVITDSQDSMTISPIDFTMNMASKGTYTAQSQPFQLTAGSSETPDFQLTFSEGSYTGNYKIIEQLKTPLSNGTGQWDSLQLSSEDIQVQLNQFAFEGGVYEADNKQLDLRFKISTDIDTLGLKELGATLTPQHINIDFTLTQLSYPLVNAYYDNYTDIEGSDLSMESLLDEEQAKQLLAEVQQNDSQLTLGLQLKAAEGNADAQGMLKLSDSGRTVATQTLLTAFEESPKQLLQWFAANLDVTIDESIAESTGLSMLLQIMLGATPEAGKYTLKAEIKESQALVNGHPML